MYIHAIVSWLVNNNCFRMKNYWKTSKINKTGCNGQKSVSTSFWMHNAWKLVNIHIIFFFKISKPLFNFISYCSSIQKGRETQAQVNLLPQPWYISILICLEQKIAKISLYKFPINNWCMNIFGTRGEHKIDSAMLKQV